MIKGILLDFDGTVVDSERSRFLASQKVLKDLGCVLTIESWNRLYKSMSSKNIFDDFIDQYKLSVTSDELYNTASIIRKEIEEKEGVPIIDGFLDFYNECLDLGLKCIVCSGGTSEHVQRVLEMNNLNLEGFGRDEYDKRKPEPDAWIKGLEKLGLKIDEVLLFDDASSGISAGIRAGIKRCCVINYSKSDFEGFGEIEKEFGINVYGWFDNWKDVNLKKLVK